MSGEGGTHTSGDLHLRSASWHPCALINKLPRFSELPLLTYRKRWCVSPGVVSGGKIPQVKGHVLQSVKAVIVDTGPCLGAGSAPLHCTPVSPLQAEALTP